MKYLLDTHVIMWIMHNDKRITKELKEKLLDTNNQIYYSTVSSWEVEIKHQKIKSFLLTGEQFCFLCDQNDILNIPIKNTHVKKLKDVILTDKTVEHKDPFDKMLMAQALAEDMTFITHDHKIEAYNIKNLIVI